MSCDGFSASSVSLKIAVLALIATLSLHIAGFALPRWSTLESDLSIDGLESFGNIESDYHVGLWRDCSCASFVGTSTCVCTSKASTSGTLRAVQALETFGLIGLVISTLITCIILLTRQDKTIRTVNIVIVFGSGIFIIVGVIVYAVECNDDYNSLFSYVEELLKDLNLDSNPAHLSTSFILCTIAGALCLLLCSTLLIVDHRTAPVVSQPQQQMHVMQTQGQILTPAPGQIIIHNANQQPGYMPPPSYAPPYQPTQPYAQGGLPYKA